MAFVTLGRQFLPQNFAKSVIASGQPTGPENNVSKLFVTSCQLCDVIPRRLSRLFVSFGKGDATFFVCRDNVFFNSAT